MSELTKREDSYGLMPAMSVQQASERFLKYTLPDPNSGCWLWSGATTKAGYGVLNLSRKVHLAHRMSYELFIGPIPEGLQLDHLCRIRCCVNPKHLEPVTNQENARRGLGGKWFGKIQSAKTHCPFGHEYSQENTMLQKGHRLCRTCRRRRWHEWKGRQVSL